MSNFVEKYKVTLSVLIGSVLIIAGTYAPILSSLLITDEKHTFTVTNWFLIGLGILFLWGRIKSIATALQNKVSKKIEE